MLKQLLLLLTIVYTLLAESYFKTENTNITLVQKEYTYNYDRLRFRYDFEEEGYFATAIADGVNYLGKSYVDSETFSYTKLLRSNTPVDTRSSFFDYNYGSAYAKLYRLYGGYGDDKNRVVLGLQNISMGVGRIWQPTNIYNPKNSYALEPDEVFGVVGALYTHYLDDTSQVTGIISIDREDKLHYALRYLVGLESADVALDLIYSENTKMIGYEIDGSVTDAGIGVRSEGAYYKSDLADFFQGLVGADYGFENGVTLIGEMLYSSETFSSDQLLDNINSELLTNMVNAHLFTAVSVSYPFTIFLDGSLSYIESFDGMKSRFFSPMLRYTFNDYNTFSIGALIYKSDEISSAGISSSQYYLKWDFSF